MINNKDWEFMTVVWTDISEQHIIPCVWKKFTLFIFVFSRSNVGWFQ